MRDTKTGQFVERDFAGFCVGKLTVLKKTGKRDKWGYSIWKVKCECGNIVDRSCQRFTSANPIQSCGCGPRGRKPTMTHAEALYKKHQFSAKARNLSFELDQPAHEKLTSSDCTYCGEKPSNRPHPYLHIKMVHNGIDRIDPSLGYVLGNVASCCPTCNFAKGTMNGVEFKEWVAKVYSHMNQ